MENKNGISENQKMIVSLYDEGMSFADIAENMGMSLKLTQVNYYYAIQKLEGTIPNKDTVLTETQQKDIAVALDALKGYLRELKELNENEEQELSYNSNDLINICKEMAEKIGIPFDAKEFI